MKFETNEDYLIFNEYNRKLITIYIICNKIEIKRGQIINTIKDEYRYANEGKLIWDGIAAYWLSYAYDECGSIPCRFEVLPEEFDPNFWVDTVEGNKYWPCIFYREQVRDSLVFDDALTKEKHWHGYFTHKGENHHVIVDDFYDENAFYRPETERNPIEFFKEEVMRMTIPFYFDANRFIDMKDINIKSSYIELYV